MRCEDEGIVLTRINEYEYDLVLAPVVYLSIKLHSHRTTVLNVTLFP